MPPPDSLSSAEKTFPPQRGQFSAPTPVMHVVSMAANVGFTFCREPVPFAPLWGRGGYYFVTYFGHTLSHSLGNHFLYLFFFEEMILLVNICSDAITSLLPSNARRGNM